MKIAKIGLFSLVCTGIGSMIGSGWLFSSYYAVQSAGPAAIFSWIITAILISCLALCLSELVSLYPKRGLLTRILSISHGKDFAILCSLSSWLGIVAVIPTEAEASVQYLSHLSLPLSNALWNSTQHQLTKTGLLASSGFMFLYFILNFWGIKLFAKSNVIFTTFKIIVPVFVAICIGLAGFNMSNFTYYRHTFFPYSGTSVLTTIISSGIIYSFNGFQSIVAFAAEAKNPKKNIPRALIISIIVTLIIYLILQTTFIASVPQRLLSNGWHQLYFNSPLVQLAGLLGLNYIAIILYLDSTLSPSGTGLIYTGTSTRMLSAMSEEKQMPAYFKKIERHLHFSRRSLIFNVLLAFFLLFFFRSWHSLINLITLFHIISYFPIPLSLAKFRITKPRHTRLIQVPLYYILAPLLFLFLSFLFLAAKANNTLYCLNFLSIFYIIYYLVQNKSETNIKFFALLFGSFILTNVACIIFIMAIDHLSTLPALSLFTTNYFNYIGVLALASLIIKITVINRKQLKNTSIILYLAILTLIDNLAPTSYAGNGTLNNVAFYGLTTVIALTFYYYVTYYYKKD